MVFVRQSSTPDIDEAAHQGKASSVHGSVFSAEVWKITRIWGSLPCVTLPMRSLLTDVVFEGMTGFWTVLGAFGEYLVVVAGEAGGGDAESVGHLVSSGRNVNREYSSENVLVESAAGVTIPAKVGLCREQGNVTLEESRPNHRLTRCLDETRPVA
ncbi:hypothetical protein MAP00_006725 [Monascus purpureus]|nr:hypothetical protein MAP00_006725 [Monascus purpureus]